LTPRDLSSEPFTHAEWIGNPDATCGRLSPTAEAVAEAAASTILRGFQLDSPSLMGTWVISFSCPVGIPLHIADTLTAQDLSDEGFAHVVQIAGPEATCGGLFSDGDAMGEVVWEAVRSRWVS
jgi:hypothetical protein